MDKKIRVLFAVSAVLFASFFMSHKAEVSAATKIEKDVYIMTHVSVVIDERLVHFNAPILNKQGSLLLPMREFYEKIGAQVFWNQQVQMASAFKDENRIDLTINSGIGIVNGDNVSMDVAPLIYQERTYIPLRFVSENLDGTVSWHQDEQRVEIDLNESIQTTPPPSYKYTSNFIGKSYGYTARPIHVPTARLEGDRSLLVSDNPERLTEYVIPSDNVTLAEQHVQSSTEKNEHRIFGWHLNQLGEKATIGITIQNKSKFKSIEVTSSKGAAEIKAPNQIIYDIGLSIADAYLNGKLKDSKRTEIRIGPGETKTIESYLVDDRKIIGFLQDVDIRSVNGGDSEYTIRTVLSKNGSDLTHIHSYQVPVSPERSHPRGVWPHSTIVADLPTYTVGSPEVGYSLSNGSSDYLQTGANSLSKLNGSTGNPGHFGMSYKVNIPVMNPTGEANTVKLKLSGRGGPYSGAVKMNKEVYLIPVHAAGKEYVELPEYEITAETETISLELMHAGGSYLPVAIYIEAQE